MQHASDETTPAPAPADVPAPADAPGTIPSLRDPAHLVSPRAVRLWTVQALLRSLVPLAAQVVWWIVDDAADRSPHLVVGIAWALLTAAYTIVMPRWRYRVHRWEATPLAVYTQSGWLSQERRIAPVSRVQTVDLHRSPLAQVFGLASVTVTTASAAGPLEIDGLDLETARELVDSLTTSTVTEEGDAT